MSPSAPQPARRIPGFALALVLGCLALAAAATSARAATPRASLSTVERQVMCVTCKIPLDVAESPQSDRERAFIQGLIDRGEDEAQIKRALVGQYGPTVLALPSTHGFDLAAYLVPVLVVLAFLGVLLSLLPRWRAQARRQAIADERESSLDEADTARLEADLARFD
jgi:cytochrome c-type biogenesis protein CcmH